MKKEIELVTIERAQALLDGQGINRPLSESMVEEMMYDISNGIFDKDEANVCLRKDGRLYYGQHILNAIVRLNDNGVELNMYKLEDILKDRHHIKGYLNRDSKYRYKRNS